MSQGLKKQADKFLEERAVKHYSAQSQGIPLPREAPRPQATSPKHRTACQYPTYLSCLDTLPLY